MPYMQAELKELNVKLSRHKQAPDIPGSVEMARELWPVISLLLRRDPNILKWGRVGLRVYKVVSAYFHRGSGEDSSQKP
jgi:hypothetical protein